MKSNPFLEWIKKNKPSRVSVLLRHAHRGPPIKRGDYYNIPLTPEGRTMAYEFGRQLLRDKLVRSFYSPVPRCKETAECIRKGVISSGGSAVLMGERYFLGTQFITNPKDMLNVMEKLGVSNFARRWLGRELDAEIIDDPHEVASKTINGLITSMQEKNDIQDKIDIHITHDWNMLPVRDIFLNVKHEEVGWPDFLDGVMLTCDDCKITLRWRDITRTIDWKSGRMNG